MKTILSLALLTVLSFTRLNAQEQTTSTGRNLQGRYNYSALGYQKVSYSAGLQTLVDNATSASGGGNVTLQGDAWGSYWPIHQNRSIVGVVGSGVIDSYSGGLNIAQISATASGIYFFNETIGDGPLIKGDVGVTALLAAGSGHEAIDNTVGMGAGVGLGYALSTSKDMSVMANVNYNLRNLGAGTSGAFGITVGVLY